MPDRCFRYVLRMKPLLCSVVVVRVKMKIVLGFTVKKIAPVAVDGVKELSRDRMISQYGETGLMQ